MQHWVCADTQECSSGVLASLFMILAECKEMREKDR